MQIDRQHFTSQINKVFSANGLGKYLTLAACEKFLTLTERMLTENEKYNLTAITDVNKIILSHYADCAMLAARLKKGAKIIDVGCGAGFPTLPIAILRPDVSILAVDSTAKRVGYVEETARLLSLGNVECVTMRAEDGGKDPKYREKFDVATARAVAEMRVLAELCLPFVRVGGEMIAMKGKNAEFELSAARKAIATLGGRGVAVETVSLTDGNEQLSHPLIIVPKKEKTPTAYPRVYAQISKKPL